MNVMCEVIDEIYRKCYKSWGLLSDVVDYFFVDCFDLKYMFEECIVFIRKKLWGDFLVVKCERGYFDGVFMIEIEINKILELGFIF